MALTTIDTYGIKDGAVQIDDIGTLAGNLTINDSGKLRLGTGLDLQLYHDASGGDSYINDVGVGSLILTTTSNSTVAIKSSAEYMAKFSTNAGVELYYDNSKKLETNSTGIHIFGNTGHADGAADLYGSGNDFSIYHDGTNSIQFFDSQVGAVKFRTDIGNSARNNIVLGQGVDLYHLNSKKAYTTSGGFKVDNKLELPDGGATGTAARITVGTGDDLKIYHDGTNNCIVGNPPLFIRTNNLLMQNGGGTEGYIGAVENGAVDLYYDNSKKFETTSAGATVTGTLTTSGTGGGSAALGSHLDLGDSQKIRLGASDDLQIYHDGSNSYIADEGTGDIIISSGTITFKNQARNETHANFIGNGACELYYDNSLKLSTYSSGVSLEEHLWLKDSKELRVGDGSDLKIYHNGSHSYIWNTTGDLQLRSNSLYVCSTSGEAYLEAAVNGAISLYYDNSKKLKTESWGVRMEDELGLYDNKKLFIGTSNDLQIFHDAGVHSYIDEIGNGNLVLRTNNSGTWSSIVLQAGSENSVIAYKNGGVELYYDAGKKFETYSAGVHVTGEAHIGHTTADPAPTSGAKTGNLLITNTSDSYGMQFGTRSSGKGWIQQTRIDGTATNYDLQLQPAGGHVWMPDNSHLMFGAGNDLKIYSDGAAGHIDHLTTGSGADLILRSKTLVVRNLSDENMIVANENGSVNLYYDNSRKFSTNSNGCSTHGHHYFDDNQKVMLGSGSDLQMYHNGANSVIENLTGALVFKPEGLMRIQDRTSGEVRADFNDNSSVDLYYDGVKKFETSSAGTKSNIEGSNTMMEQYGVRAWVSFNGRSFGVKDSGNVSSVTDNGTGQWTVNFDTDFPDANYACGIAATGGDSSDTSLETLALSYNTQPAAGSLKIVYAWVGSYTYKDSDYVSLIVVR